ncbi:hypothetical protein AKJ36_03330 [candidate division MSBL1 archaeon SCGC-AAA259I07]|uniref:Uncharacterized protein n=1 Tax=candidate division MSBL1 archaeon SCGC-AAA259I07 TaxID=1698266 RepID=A0A133UJE9_9EURY|nr:hypothetical protein AKJ36_03330 [candidate division MSBL1 archaeon SCGC-AAA259I07]
MHDKHRLLTEEGSWEILKEGVEEGRYPPSEENPEKRIEEYSNMALKYIEEISEQCEPEQKIEWLETIIEKCRGEIQKTEIDEK